jgi:hypothetical protein
MTTMSQACRRVLVFAAVSAWAAAARAQDVPSDTPTSDMEPPDRDAAPAPTYEAPAPQPAAPEERAAAPAPRPAPPARHHRRQESSGRHVGLLWFGPELGLSVVDLKMISYDQLLPAEVDVKETGLGFGAAAGVRLQILSVGLHLAVGQFTSFDVWALNLDGQLRIPLGFIEPYLRVGLGYAFLGSFQGTDMKGVDVNGWDAQVGFGIDLYPADFFSLGAGADLTILNLSRTASPTSVDLTQDGAAVGLAVWLQVKAALHF